MHSERESWCQHLHQLALDAVSKRLEQRQRMHHGVAFDQSSVRGPSE
jgi:hypothetical protein